MASLIAALPGCASHEPMEATPFTDAPPLSITDGAARPDRWWEAFNDPSLDASVESALSQNFSLRIAYERLREADAITGIERSFRSPTLDATASGGLFDGSDVDNHTEIALGLQASYEVDLWGRISANIEAAELEADATFEDLQAAGVSLSAEIATAVYRHTEASLQLLLLESQVQTNRDVLTVIEERFAIGQSDGADVLRQRQLVEATLEQHITTRATLDVLEHQILVLTGAPPQESTETLSPEQLPEIPRLPEVGLPAELLQRRPDVRAAFLRLQSTDASVAAAVRDQYPALNIGAAISTAAENPSGLFDSWIATLTGQLIAPIIDGDRRKQEVQRALAVRRQQLAAYGDTVLLAFQEVEDALALERFQILRIDNLMNQLELARVTYRQLRNQYLNGAADFIDVLVALRNQQDLERALLSARLAHVEFRISLYRAIAGGFELQLTADAAPHHREYNETQ